MTELIIFKHWHVLGVSTRCIKISQKKSPSRVSQPQVFSGLIFWFQLRLRTGLGPGRRIQLCERKLAKRSGDMLGCCDTLELERALNVWQTPTRRHSLSFGAFHGQLWWKVLLKSPSAVFVIYKTKMVRGRINTWLIFPVRNFTKLKFCGAKDQRNKLKISEWKN